MQEFVDAWTRGEKKGVFTAEKFTVDITRSPVPRFDLLKFNKYLYPGVQFSRGCPFTCEFCDIIELFGRVPRDERPMIRAGESSMSSTGIGSSRFRRFCR